MGAANRRHSRTLSILIRIGIFHWDPLRNCAFCVTAGGCWLLFVQINSGQSLVTVHVQGFCRGCQSFPFQFRGRSMRLMGLNLSFSEDREYVPARAHFGPLDGSLKSRITLCKRSQDTSIVSKQNRNQIIGTSPNDDCATAYGSSQTRPLRLRCKPDWVGSLSLFTVSTPTAMCFGSQMTQARSEKLGLFPIALDVERGLAVRYQNSTEEKWGRPNAGVAWLGAR